MTKQEFTIRRQERTATGAMYMTPTAYWHSLPDFVYKHNLIHPANVHTLTLKLNPNPTNPNGFKKKSIIQLKIKFDKN